MSATDHALRFLRFVTHGPVAILAALGQDVDGPKMFTGKWNRLEDMAAQAVGLSNEYRESFPAIYYSLNPPKPEQVKYIGASASTP